MTGVRKSGVCGAIVALSILFIAATADAEDLPATGSGPVQTALEQVIADLDLERAAQRERLAVAVVVMRDDEPPGLGMINGHTMMYAASLPKIAILYAAALALDRDRITLTDSLQDDITAMIRHSCNDCATRVAAAVGREWLLVQLQYGKHRFYDPDTGGGLWVGKDYARGSAYRRDPLKGLSHGATPWQVARWYYLLAQGELASPEQTTLMMDALSRPGIAHKFVRGLAGVVDVSGMYRKSGTWRTYHADSVLVRTDHGSYVLVALANDRDGGRWMERLARAVHDQVFIPLTSRL